MLESTLISNFSSKITIKYKTQFLYFIGTFILISMVINQPFLSISFAPRLPRLALEAFILILLSIAWFLHERNKYIGWALVTIALALGINYFLNPENLIRYIGFFNKVSFGLLFFNYLKDNPNHTHFYKSGWTIIWTVISIWSVISFCSFAFFPELFHPVNFGEIDVHAPYGYHISDWYQFITPRTFFEKILIGRVVGVFFEPIHLGYFAWLNVLMGNVLLKQRKWQILYTLMSFGVGLLSFSLFFYVVAVLLTPIFVIKNSKYFSKHVRSFGFFWMIFIAIVCLSNLDFFLSSGSGSQRLFRMESALKAFADNTIWTWFLGNGTNIHLKYMEYGFVSGLFEVCLTKGLIVCSIVTGFIVYLTRKDFILLVSVFIWSFGLNPFYYLLFYFLLTLAYHLNNEASVVQQNSARL